MRSTPRKSNQSLVREGRQTLSPNLDELSLSRQTVKAFGVPNEDNDIQRMEISRRPVGPNDVQIKLLYCGLCHSDIHHCYNEWKDSMYPMVPGHEMIGIVQKVGANVTEFEKSNIVCVGNLVNSCRSCEQCKKGNEQYCENGGPSWVYNGHERIPGELYPNGELTFGGYSQMIIVDKDFVVLFPEKSELRLEAATPLLCAGITMYNPLKQHRVGPGKKVGVAGIGGLGHLAIKMIKAMGATAVAITHTEWKIKDAKRLGATEVIFSPDNAEMKYNQSSLDLILDTIPHPHNLDPYLNLLKVDGTLHILGVLEPIPQPFNGKKITNFNRKIMGSNVGGIPLTVEMLDFCSKHKIEADVVLITLEEARDAFDKVRNSEVAYRYVFDLRQLK